MLRLSLVFTAVIGAASVVRASDEVTYRGEFLSGRMAVGGETTGFALRYRAPDGTTKTVELDIPPEQARRFKSGSRVRVTGTLTEREYVERGKVQVLVVREIIAEEGQ